MAVMLRNYKIEYHNNKINRQDTKIEYNYTRIVCHDTKIEYHNTKIRNAQGDKDWKYEWRSSVIEIRDVDRRSVVIVIRRMIDDQGS